MKKYILLSISCFCIVLLNATNHSVTTVGNTFSPANITINQGDTVTWTNGGGFHNVNATLSTYPNNPEGFGNSVSSSSWTFQHIFTIVGTYNYQCDPHTSMGMVGTVVVNAVSTPNSLTEAVARRSSTLVSHTDEKPQADPRLDRMKRLAGLN